VRQGYDALQKEIILWGVAKLRYTPQNRAFFIGETMPCDGFEAAIHPIKTMSFFMAETSPCDGFEAIMHKKYFHSTRGDFTCRKEEWKSLPTHESRITMAPQERTI
jgi:hypothetical protein